MTIRLKCPGCGTKLKVKDELGGKKGKCPNCKQPVQIPLPEPEPEATEELADLSTADQLFEEDFAAAPTLEEKAAQQQAAAAAESPTGDADEPLPFDSLLDDDEPAPQIILAGGEKPGGSSIAAGGGLGQPAEEHKPVTQTGERIFDPGELPAVLGKLNHYLICDHKEIVARWENDGRGWMIHLKDGFTRAATVENQIPQFGNFILIEVAVERRDDGLHLKAINVYQLRRQYALTKIAKGDDAVLETIVDYAELNNRQHTHVKNLVKSIFLPHMWGEMEAILGVNPQ